MPMPPPDAAPVAPTICAALRLGPLARLRNSNVESDELAFDYRGLADLSASLWQRPPQSCLLDVYAARGGLPLVAPVRV